MSSLAEISIKLDSPKKNAKYRHPSLPSDAPVYLYGDFVKGKLSIELKTKSPIVHNGIAISLYGVYKNIRSGGVDQFFSKTLQLLPQSSLAQSINCPFSFDRIPFTQPTYYGTNVNIEYYVECMIERSGENISKRADLTFIRTAQTTPCPFHKGIGISNVIHMDVILASTNVDPRQYIIGELYFALLKLKIVTVGLELIRKESAYEEGFIESSERVLGSFELLDGAPVRGTEVPIRWYLGGLNCWPLPNVKGARISCEYNVRVRATDENGEIYVKLLPIQLSFQQ